MRRKKVKEKEEKSRGQEKQGRRSAWETGAPAASEWAPSGT
jgi:hypothetical protein